MSPVGLTKTPLFWVWMNQSGLSLGTPKHSTHRPNKAVLKLCLHSVLTSPAELEAATHILQDLWVVNVSISISVVVFLNRVFLSSTQELYQQMLIEQSHSSMQGAWSPHSILTRSKKLSRLKNQQLLWDPMRRTQSRLLPWRMERQADARRLSLPEQVFVDGTARDQGCGGTWTMADNCWGLRVHKPESQNARRTMSLEDAHNIVSLVSRSSSRFLQLQQGRVRGHSETPQQLFSCTRPALRGHWLAGTSPAGDIGASVTRGRRTPTPASSGHPVPPNGEKETEKLLWSSRPRGTGSWDWARPQDYRRLPALRAYV